MKIKRIVNKILKRTISGNVIKEISYERLKKLLKSNTNMVLLDVRSPQEFAEVRINSAINIPLYDIARKANTRLPNKNSLIVLYCQSGDRSKKAYRILENLGYTNLYELKGGLDNIY